MSDPRFSRLKSDPRFRRLKRKDAKVVVDDRFKSIFDQSKKKDKKRGAGRSVDKYGRPVSDNQEHDNLRQFYRLENEEEPAGPDYARGEVLLQSSDEEDNAQDQEEGESEDDGIVILGTDKRKPQEDEDAEINLDENDFADLEAQAAEYSKAHPDESQDTDVMPTRRIAVVNLDWDHVRAIHLYKVFSSLVSPTPSVADNGKSAKNVVRGKILSVRVYPSQFGKERMAKEEKEGPPAELFKKKAANSDDELTANDIIEIGDAQDYDEDALRKYQLERLRYYYAIVECDSVQTATHVYNELQGTELEYSANVFDLSYVPDDMSFEEECRDEANDDANVAYKALDFVTDALRHSRVKLTWDEDDPERVRVTRRALSKKEIEEADFKAYIASSSESEEDPSHREEAAKKGASRDKLRALLLGGTDELPEGWGTQDNNKADVDMEITFTPGLSESKDQQGDETTLEKYQRKMKEKRKKRKEELKTKAAVKEEPTRADDFFGSDSEGASAVEGDVSSERKGKSKGSISRHVSTAEELSLLAAADNPEAAPRHFDMKAVVKSEKARGKKRRSKKNPLDEGENETQEDFKIDVQDERFAALHEDYNFAIDPSNPRFKKTKSMSALLEERSKRKKATPHHSDSAAPRTGAISSDRTLESLVQSVKRKSVATEGPSNGKRRKA
ncbi:hypothetical protein GLOTRDRAFT_102368 [Gloeophyllum trabeum ATCC 11539]|uniref:Uncharacterized protein n=1 Tax=Gloeophyllum trabeum (strain ATCC 11539 / FP-39264 / Madison 617) TaxID=670483 RepID=S7S439_GLOTA|nr:uncharacterized protein GLOTRDRAFT_102368 [Gloeophyllum trabeum ATCC 11539]EPQ60624.1 hypothetical protein GLOTRDRAFT_102368 [Gloeophyllum trabeum ATCC 11539]